MSTVAQFCFNKPFNRDANGKIIDDIGNPYTWEVVGNQPTIQFDQAVSGSAALLSNSFFWSYTLPLITSSTFEFWAKLISFNYNSCAFKLGGINYDLFGFYGNYTNPLYQLSYSLDSTINASATFNHYCLTSTPDTITLFVNGKKKASRSYSNGGMQCVKFGGNDVPNGGGYANLYLDSFRLSDKVLYTDDFTPPTEFQLKYKIESDPLGDYYGIKKV